MRFQALHFSSLRFLGRLVIVWCLPFVIGAVPALAQEAAARMTVKRLTEQPGHALAFDRNGARQDLRQRQGIDALAGTGV